MRWGKQKQVQKNRGKIRFRFRFTTRIHSSFPFIVLLTSSHGVFLCWLLNVICIRVGTLEAWMQTLNSVLEAVVDKWARPGVISLLYLSTLGVCWFWPPTSFSRRWFSMSAVINFDWADAKSVESFATVFVRVATVAQLVDMAVARFKQATWESV